MKQKQIQNKKKIYHNAKKEEQDKITKKQNKEKKFGAK